MSVFGDRVVRLDPWQVEYGAEVTAIDHVSDPEAVDLEVEHPLKDWQPIHPGEVPAPDRIFFVDGVRRLEARVVVRDDDGYVFGGFGSYGVGATEVKDGHASFAVLGADHIVATGAGLRLDEDVALRPGLLYRAVSTQSREEDGPLRAIHSEMRIAEERLGRQLAAEADALVITDGPLSFEEATPGDVVGYVKRVMELYLSGEALAVLEKLPAASRTPIFSIRASKRFARYAWFQRLEAPRPGDADYSGIVRLEVSEVVGLETARKLADACTRLIPRFRGKRGLHARGPQNLIPIGALEQRLRRELGDPRLLRRLIETLIAREAAQ